MEAERALGTGRLTLGVDASGRFGLRATNETIDYTAGGEVSTRTTEVSIDSARRDDFGLFAALSGHAGSVELAGGARYDRVGSQSSGGYFGDRSRKAGDFSGFLAATIPVGPGWSVTGQVARGFREPLLSDRYYRGISGRGFITGNPDLDAETSRQADAALRWSGGGVRVALYGFWYRIEDLIERHKVGSSYFFRNRQDAEVRGVELEATVELPASLLLQVAGQHHRGEVREDGSAVDGVPADGLVLTLRRDPAERWWWLARILASSRDERPGPTERVVPGYAVVDVGLGCRLADAAQVQLLVRNILNHAYLGSADEKTILAAGRTVQLTLRGRI
jgi:iron complex outermembrane receptor protein